MAAALEKTPMCEVTGLPLPIFHKEPPTNGAPFSFQKNYHHHFHPERSPALQTVAGLAVRGSRVQHISYALHTNYHNLFTGPELPENEDDAFRIAVLSASGVVPRSAIDVSKPRQWREVRLNNYDHSFLSRPKIIGVDKPGNLALFLAEYAAKQDIQGSLDNIIIDEFLNRNTPKVRKQELARMMLTEALNLSLEELNQTYAGFKKEGYLRSRSETFRAVAKRLIRCHSLGHYSKAVTHRLIAT
ncbi:MAG: hypothetical protein ACR2FM_04145 [Candidatus Saccharimonadales bacterium]